MPVRISVMPGEGAVCPATVKNGFRILISCLAKSITPPTSNTTIRGPSASSAAPSDPGPVGASVVTLIILPPRPPTVWAAHPCAPGKAGKSSAEIAFVDTMAAARSSAPATDFVLIEPPQQRPFTRPDSGFAIVNDTGFLYTGS